MRQTELDRMLTQWVVQEIAIGIIATAITLFILYLVIRCAVRDGMRDAQRGMREQREPARQRAANTANLPEMRAD